MEILIENQQEYPTDIETLRSLSLYVLESEGMGAGTELSVVLIPEKEMALLNQKYLGKEGATDVLAFPMDECEDQRGVRLLGDVVICPEEVLRRRDSYAVKEGEEIALVLIHGILHLLGYQDASVEENEIMDRRQRKLLDEWRNKK